MAEREWDERAKGIFELVREIALAALLLLVFFHPQFLQDRLKKMGVNKVEAAGVGIEIDPEKTLSEATQVETLRHTVENLREAVAVAEKQLPESQRPALSSIVTSLQQSEAPAAKLDQTLKSRVLAQQIRSNEAGKTAPKTGWLYLGKIDESRSKWAAGSPMNVRPLALRDLSQGAMLTVAGTSFIREDGGKGSRAAAPVIGVLPDGTRVKVLEVDQESHAISGGWFCWVRAATD